MGENGDFFLGMDRCHPDLCPPVLSWTFLISTALTCPSHSLNTTSLDITDKSPLKHIGAIAGVPNQGGIWGRIGGNWGVQSRGFWGNWGNRSRGFGGILGLLVLFEWFRNGLIVEIEGI